MSKKPQIPEAKTLSEESESLYDVLNNESDLACVLIATSYLDYALASLLKHYFVQSNVVNKLLEPPRGALLTFASRSDMAYCLGLISKGLYQNLETIGKIRNAFAHSYLSLKLDDSELTKLVDSLIFPTMHQSVTVDGDGVKYSGPAPFHLTGPPRTNFNMIVVFMVNSLLRTGLATEHIEKKIKEW